MPKSMRVYIAAPYTATNRKGLEVNTARAIDAGIEIFKKGHFPYIPHLTHFVDLRAKRTGISLGWADYIEWDIPWLELCDALLYLGKSKGADLELRKAKRMKKRLFFSISEIPQVKRKSSSKRM
jgi:hypothetical protein